MAVPEAAAPRDRFIAFAFAGADLLIEASIDGAITFAAGAFRQRMGIEPEQAVGRQLQTLVAAPDRVTLTMALGALAARGRILPIVLRLNDAARTPASFAALVVPSTPPRICVTLGPVPTASEARGPVESGDPRGFAREAEARLREGGGGELALVEVSNWRQVQAQLSGEDQKALRAGIAETFGTAGAEGAAQELADGRFSVLVRDTEEVAGIVRRLDTLVRGSPAGRVAKVEGLGLSLTEEGLMPSQAARALRYALSQFRSGGMEAAKAVGGAEGLAGVLSRVAGKARLLRVAIVDKKFQLKYQPVVSLVDRSIHHFEALLRPFAPLIAPNQTTQDFVLSVEAMGLTEELDCAVTEMALATLRGQPDVSIAVNVSGLSIQSDTFQDRLLTMLADPALGGPATARRLLIELTETVEVDDMVTAAASIAELRALGIQVCLDDFGAGAAAFRYLREFQVDVVKIDGLYVRRATLGARERSFVTSMVDLAAAVGARVIAEMVETEEEAQLMRLLGVEFGQGWLFGRPGTLPGRTR
jgi:EAL domain-containing protein (putative c-di-GMP-specific phosphodiesterase class I)